MATGVVACSPDDELVTANEAEAKENLALFEEQGPASYVYVLQRKCDCPNTGEWVRIVIEDGVVQSALNASGDEAAGGTPMPEMLRGIVDWTRHDPLVFEATYDPDLGYLVHLKLDLSELENNEYELTVDCFGEGTGDDVCPLDAETTPEP